MNPTMAPQEAKLYESLLDTSKVLLEYGSGGSTYLALQRPELRVTSVDSDLGWFEKLRENELIRIAERDGRLTLLYVDIGPTGKWGRPTDKGSRYKWPEYSALPWREMCPKPDLILIDGRFRVACALESVRHMEEGAKIVVHDFWTRRFYRIMHLYLKCTDRIGSLAVFERRPKIRRWLLDLLLTRYKTDPR